MVGGGVGSDMCGRCRVGDAGKRCSRRATRNLLVLACEACSVRTRYFPSPMPSRIQLCRWSYVKIPKKSFTRNEWTSGRGSWQRALYMPKNNTTPGPACHRRRHGQEGKSQTPLAVPSIIPSLTTPVRISALSR